MNSDRETSHKPNPREGNRNGLSLLTYWWMRSLFRTALKRELNESDIYKPLKSHRSDVLGDKLSEYWNKETLNSQKTGKSPSFGRAVLKCFKRDILLCGLLNVALEFGCNMTQPLALGKFISYYIPGHDGMTKGEAYMYAVAVIGCSLLNVLLLHPYVLLSSHIGMKMNAAACSLVYRKSLRLGKVAIGETTTGQVVNLVSNDANRLNYAVMFIHYLWIGPCMTLALGYFMYEEIGPSALIGIAFMLAFIPLHGWVGKKASTLRLKTALKTDQRLMLMSEIISGIQVIKMYAWEKPFALLVKIARKKEVVEIRKMAYLQALNQSTMSFITRISIFLCIVAYVSLDNDVTAKKVFVVTACYNVLKLNMTEWFPLGIMFLAEALVSTQRIQNFLLTSELEGSGVRENTFDLDFAMKLTKVNASWKQDSNRQTLTEINLQVEKGHLIGIIGSFGSGKSSLLEVLLKELPINSGSVILNGTVSYAPQEPWLFAGTIRQNILFGQPMEQARYDEAIRVCALQKDFAAFPHDDLSRVGEKGISLSGGQRARINLARAVYRQADIYLMDDPLSAVDARVGRQLFDDCICAHLAGRTRLLVTHQLQYLKGCDKIAYMSEGRLVAYGTFQQLLAMPGLEMAQWLDSRPTDDAVDDEKAFDEERADADAEVPLERGEKVEKTEDEESEEMRTAGSVSGAVYGAYLRAGGNVVVVCLLAALFILAQAVISMGDYFITFWVNLEESRLREIAALKARTLLQADFTGFWDMSRETCIYTYTAISAAIIALSLGRAFSFYTFCSRASARLHDGLFRGISRAKMLFFNLNPSGRIMNRFSKDVGAIDEMLPLNLLECLIIGLQTIGMMTMIGIVNPWLVILAIIMLVLFFGMRAVYVPASRGLKRIQGTTRSPVISHLNASLQGLPIIRAFGRQSVLSAEFDGHQDLNSSTTYLGFCCARALSFWMDIVCVLFIAATTMSFLILDADAFGGNVGLAITQCVGMTGVIQFGIRLSTELMNQMTSVERVLEYSNVEKEPELETPPHFRLGKHWPERGGITFDHASLRYSPNGPDVLQDITVAIEAGEKIGVVGRTGAGKSSLITALFRLAEPQGRILIDDRNILQLGLHDLRSRISIIPQEPVLFTGTLRMNLDPFGDYPDSALRQALEDVELKEMALQLQKEVSGGGSNFSVGQRQLLCLARAILRRNRILIMDEATANIDPITDAMIQQTLRNKFASCTVITIAHRLNTVMDSHKILVMDNGRAVEFGVPADLVGTNGHLSKMIEQTGEDMARALVAAAKKTTAEAKIS